jgi:polyisoprenoid-binding protein YceI
VEDGRSGRRASGAAVAGKLRLPGRLLTTSCLRMTKLLQVIGVATLIAIVGLAVAALLFCQQRIRIVVQPDDAAVKPDASALLRDDLQQLTQAQHALAQAVSDNFTRLQQATEAAAAMRHAELLRSLQRIDALTEASTALGNRIARLEAGVQVGGAPTPVAPVEVPATLPLQPLPRAEDGKPPAPTVGFLSFQLPSAQFHFDRVQQYELLPELSRVGFDAKSTLHDFSGVTSTLRGQFSANLADPAGGWTGSVACRVATLVTGVDGRDASLREHLDSEQHPEIRFDLTGFTPAKDGIDAGKMTVRGEGVGTMTIHGTARELRLPLQVSVDASRRVLIEGDAPLKMSDYGVAVPSQLGVINVQDEVKVWLSLRARAKVGQ